MNPTTNINSQQATYEDFPKKNVLIIHDDAAQLQTRLQSLLDFCTLYMAQTDQEAIDVLQDETGIQLVISDLAMLTAGNYRLLKYLKLNEAFWHIPVVNILPFPNATGKFISSCISVRDFALQELEADDLSVLVKELLQNGSQTPSYSGARTAYASGNLLSEEDITWINNLECLVTLHLADPSYSVSKLAFDLHLSKSTFSRKLKYLLGVNPGQYITQIRMQKAKKMLENRRYNSVAQVSFAVGFRHPGAFSRCFHHFFQVSPIEIMK